MTDLSQPGELSAIERARLSTELMQIRAALAASDLNPLERARTSARGLVVRQLLGEASKVSPEQGQAAFERAREFYQSSLKDQVVQSVVGPVTINGVGWRKAKMGMKSDVLKARLIEHVREILETGSAGQRQAPTKTRNDNFVAFYFIQKQVQIDDLLVTAGVTVAEDMKGNLFYNVSHAGRESWQAKENGASDVARVGPRESDDADNGMLDGVPTGAVPDTVADGDINITILQVVQAAQEQAPAGAQTPAPGAPKYEIIEYTTKRDKVLRGIIRADLSLAEARAIDPYTWRINGGYFIREKHLGVDTSAQQAAPTPTVLTAEQEAERQERDTRLALERQQQAISHQVEKLRDAGGKAIEAGTGVMNADRKTNTHRRAGMAASAYARGANDESEGATLNNIADAIEVGAGGALASLTSRTQLQELKRVLSLAKYESEKGLSYQERQARTGQPFTADDVNHVRMPVTMVWSTRYRNAALNLAKKAPTGNSQLIAALTKMSNRVERWQLRDEGDIAITRKAHKILTGVKEGWDLKDPIEALARVDRLKRMGITTDSQLQDACRALLPHMAAKQEESAVTKAERALIGQTVGIDFFPTPVAVAHRMARLAGISKGMRVLEPSAGNGNLADAAAAAGGAVDVVEISSQLREILSLKGHTVVANDFNDFTPEAPYPAIVMNPPFSKRQDAEHIMRAFALLAGGGTLVAIAGEGVFFGQDQKALQFRGWLDSHNATVEKLEGGTFTDNALLAQTTANARLIVLKK